MIYIISIDTFGEHEVHDIQCNSCWSGCAIDGYALIPDGLVEGILETSGYCDIVLNNDGTEVSSFTARPEPFVERKCTATPVVMSVNGVTADASGNVQLPGNGSGTVETPVFNLAEMGLTAVSLAGGYSTLEIDTAEIRAALNNGAVTFVIPVETSGMTMQANITMTGASLGADYQCISVVDVSGPSFLVVNVNSTTIMVACASLAQAVGLKTATSVNMSSFESEGRIVETFADGSTATTIMEFDSNGKPTKITDGNGNVTVLTW